MHPRRAEAADALFQLHSDGGGTTESRHWIRRDLHTRQAHARLKDLRVDPGRPPLLLVFAQSGNARINSSSTAATGISSGQRLGLLQRLERFRRKLREALGLVVAVQDLGTYPRPSGRPSHEFTELALISQLKDQRLDSQFEAVEIANRQRGVLIELDEYEVVRSGLEPVTGLGPPAPSPPVGVTVPSPLRSRGPPCQ